jgi:hypothetical protein
MQTVMPFARQKTSMSGIPATSTSFDPDIIFCLENTEFQYFFNIACLLYSLGFSILPNPLRHLEAIIRLSALMRAGHLGQNPQLSQDVILMPLASQEKWRSFSLLRDILTISVLLSRFGVKKYKDHYKNRPSFRGGFLKNF